jgi:hypothetical protein
MARREVGANSRGILNTPTMEKKKMVLTAIKKEYCKDPVRTGRSN